MPLFLWVSLWITSLAASVASPAQVLAPDWKPWDALLVKHVKPVTRDGIALLGVDYAALRAGRAPIDALVKSLATYDPLSLRDKPEVLAFWINVYNLGAVKWVLDEPALGSLNGSEGKGAIWKLPILKVGGKDYSLDQIENDILRLLGEPRIHFAIVCGSVSCPDLRTGIYRADKLDEQLEQATRGFLRNPKKGASYDEKAGVLTLSKIFEWFEHDFGGASGVRFFVRQRLVPTPPSETWDKATLRTFDYNWKLNRL